MNWIATFYSHFGAVRFLQQCKAAGIPARLSPVPRDLSSSCGTCARYEADRYCPSESVPEEVEQIAEICPDGYKVVYKAADS